MPTRRDFLHASGAAALALATPEGEAQARPAGSTEVARWRQWAPEPTYLGRPARFWLGRLLDRNTVEYSRFAEQNDSHREETYHAVAAFGERIVPELRRIMLRGRDSGRRYALQVLSRMGPVGESVLLDAACDPRGNLRADALSSLARNFPNSANLPSLLLAALDDDVQEVRLCAVESLWFIREEAKPILEKALRHADPAVRRSAATQIPRIDPSREFAEPLLLGLLGDKDLEVRWGAVQAAFLHVPVSPSVVPVLVQLIHAGCLAAAGYLPFAGASGLSEAITLLEHSDVAIRAATVAALAKFVCSEDRGPEGASRELTDLEAEQLVMACRHAAQDNDLAVKVPARRVVAVLEQGSLSLPD